MLLAMLAASALAAPLTDAQSAAASTPLASPAVATGQISGTVTSAETKLPIAGIEVCATSEEVLGELAELFLPCSITAASGMYTIPGIQPGEYKVGFAAPFGSGLNYVPQYYDGKPTVKEAQPVTVTPGGEVQNINAEMHPGAEVEGKVTAASTHAGISGIEVCALTSGEGLIQECTTTGPGGEYTLTNLPTAAYKVLFSASSASELNYVPQFYDDAASFSTATAVSATAGGIPVAGINAEMQAGGEITGTVIAAPTKSALKAVEVCALVESAGKEEAVGCALSAANGDYTIAGLPTGEYRVGFRAARYAQQYYMGKTSFSAAQPVSVTAGDTTPLINAELIPEFPVAESPPTISGNPTQGQTLEEHNGSWSNAPTKYAYQWERCSASGTSCAAIPGATGQSYLLAGADVGDTIRVEETAANASGTGAPAFSATTAVVSTPPPPPQPAGQTGGSGGGESAADGVLGFTTASISSAQIAALLGQELTPAGKAAKIATLLKNGAFTVTFKALEAGRAVIDWYQVPLGAKLAKKTKAKPILVASGQMTFSAAGTAKIKIKLTATGKRLLKNTKSLKLTGKATFTPTGKAPVAVTKAFVLKQ
jgi:Carboxypeptidase regulatory-like domain